jgi:hypothetical protein
MTPVLQPTWQEWDRRRQEEQRQKAIALWESAGYVRDGEDLVKRWDGGSSVLVGGPYGEHWWRFDDGRTFKTS